MRDIYTDVLACSYIAEEIEDLFREQIGAATQSGMKVKGIEEFHARAAELCERLDRVLRALMAQRKGEKA